MVDTTKRSRNSLGDRTITDFGQQWMEYSGNDGFYASLALFEDILGPLVRVQELVGCRVADIGSGTGRIVNMLVQCGAREVMAIEPSDAYNVLVGRLNEWHGAVRAFKMTGDQLPK